MHDAAQDGISPTVLEREGVKKHLGNRVKRKAKLVITRAVQISADRGYADSQLVALPASELWAVVAPPLTRSNARRPRRPRRSLHSDQTDDLEPPHALGRGYLDGLTDGVV